MAATISFSKAGRCRFETFALFGRGLTQWRRSVHVARDLGQGSGGLGRGRDVRCGPSLRFLHRPRLAIGAYALGRVDEALARGQAAHDRRLDATTSLAKLGFGLLQLCRVAEGAGRDDSRLRLLQAGFGRGEALLRAVIVEAGVGHPRQVGKAGRGTVVALAVDVGGDGQAGDGCAEVVATAHVARDAEARRPRGAASTPSPVAAVPALDRPRTEPGCSPTARPRRRRPTQRPGWPCAFAPRPDVVAPRPR